MVRAVLHRHPFNHHREILLVIPEIHYSIDIAAQRVVGKFPPCPLNFPLGFMFEEGKCLGRGHRLPSSPINKVQHVVAEVGVRRGPEEGREGGGEEARGEVVVSDGLTTALSLRRAKEAAGTLRGEGGHSGTASPRLLGIALTSPAPGSAQ